MITTTDFGKTTTSASVNVCEGIIRTRYRHSLYRASFLKPGKIYSIPIDLWPTSIVFNKGHRLRLHVTSSSAPGYEPNPNKAEPLRASNRSAIAHNTVYVSHRCASYVDLPVVTGN
jgi:putative CocE/NonD family hydrolase